MVDQRPITGVAISVLPPVNRFNLRIAPAGLPAASDALGLDLPSRIGDGTRADDRTAWCLGPDEWLLHALENAAGDIVAAFDSIRAHTPHSLTDISDREISIAIDGPSAVDILSVGCPQNFALIRPGGARRTVFDSAQVVILRDTPERFRIEVGRSFFPHVHALLQIASNELASGL